MFVSVNYSPETHLVYLKRRLLRYPFPHSPYAFANMRAANLQAATSAPKKCDFVAIDFLDVVGVHRVRDLPVKFV